MSWSGRRRGFPRTVALAIIRRDPVCRLQLPGCTGVSTEADHITPTAEGGSDHPSNGRGVCAHCHGVVTRGQAVDGIRRMTAKGKYPRPASPGLIQPN